MDNVESYYCDEYKKCKENYLYFLSHLGITLDDQQKNYLNTVNKDRFTILLAPRQSGKDYTTLPYLLWYALFHSNKNIVIVGHSFEESKVLLEKINVMIDKFTNHYSDKFINLFPTISNNPYNGKIEFSNGSTISINGCKSSNGVCHGFDVDILYFSEFGFISNAESLFASSYPIISKRQSPKIIIASTAPSYAFGEFYKQWVNALNHLSNFTPVRWYFEHVKHFSKEFKDETLKSLGQERWETEFECIFSESLPKTIGNCPADYFKYFRSEDKKHGYVLYEMIKQLKGLNYSKVEEIVHILINIVNEKQKNDIFN